METRASYLTVGIAVLLLLGAGVGFVIWMASQDTADAYKRYWVDFDGSVSGLKAGSTVTYRGISVGQVIELKIRPDNVEKVRATIEIDAETPIKVDTVASQQLQGLAGGSAIQLSGGSQEAATLAEPTEGLSIIKSEASSLEKLFEGAPALVDRIDVLVTRASLLLDDENRRSVAAILQNVETLTGNLANASEPTDQLIAEALQTVTSIRGTAERVEALTVELETQLTESLEGISTTISSASQAVQNVAGALNAVETAANRIGNASAEFQGMVAENRVPIRDFTNVTLYDANAFIAEVRELVISLRQITNDLNRDPSGFFFGNQKRGFNAR
jgi:phospholipid/cholesterol/gamma-HCH transport system substrate-binding protein